MSHLSQSFDSASWKTSLTSDSFEPIRLRMVDDLLHRHRLRGMTREEVVSLLGTPPEPNYFRDYDLAYWLGSERGDFSLDSEWWLAIRPFDRRIVAQGAVFTYHHDVRGPLKCEKVREEYKGAAPEGVNLVRIRVTAGGKRHLQRQLSDLGISRKTLFPDLEGLSAFLNWRTKRGMWTREQLAGRQEMAFPA